MDSDEELLSEDEVDEVARRIGLAHDELMNDLRGLDFPVRRKDLRRRLERQGMTLSEITNRLGGSP